MSSGSPRNNCFPSYLLRTRLSRLDKSWSVGILLSCQSIPAVLIGNRIVANELRQVLVENAKVVALRIERYPVRLTPKRHLREVDFVFEGNVIRGLEQNPQTKSRWAQMARSGKKVMQFLTEGRYVANVVDGKVNFYSGST